MKGQLHNEEKPHYMNFSLFVFLHKKKEDQHKMKVQVRGKQA